MTIGVMMYPSIPRTAKYIPATTRDWPIEPVCPSATSVGNAADHPADVRDKIRERRDHP